MDQQIFEENKLHWFVMMCQRSERIEDFIDEFNAREDIKETNRVQDYFIPYLAIRRRSVSRQVPDFTQAGDDRRGDDQDRKSNELRNDMRHFVFILATPKALGLLRQQYWHIGHTYLRHLRDRQGNEIVVRAEMMEIFINACLEYREKFELHTKNDDIVEGVKVIVRNGAFKDFKAEVYNIHYKGDGIRFSIAIRFFANDKYVHIHDRTPEDVSLVDGNSIVFNADFIDRLESGILSILSRKVNKKITDETKKEDVRQLKEYYKLRHALIDDSMLGLRLDALMSICASLSKNDLEKSKYNRILKQHTSQILNGEQTPSSHIAHAYLLAALFISTKDPKFRNQLKTVVHQYLPEHQSLRRFVSLIRNM